MSSLLNENEFDDGSNTYKPSLPIHIFPSASSSSCVLILFEAAGKLFML